MSNIYQSDLFIFLVDYLNYREIEIASKLSDLISKTVYPKNMSEIINSKEYGYSNLHAFDLYESTIEEYIKKHLAERKYTPGSEKEKEARLRYEKDILKKAHLFVEEYNLSFEGYEGYENDTCKSYLMRMFTDGAINHNNRTVPLKRMRKNTNTASKDFDIMVNTNELRLNLDKLTPSQLSHIDAIIKDIIK